MTTPLSIIVDSKKYMWDSVPYESEDQARQTMAAYEKDGFKVQMTENENQFFVYSRRIAAEQHAEE